MFLYFCGNPVNRGSDRISLHQGWCETLPSFISLRRFSEGEELVERGQIMKILLCALLMTFSVCFADVCDPPPDSGIFKIICSLDVGLKKLEESVDSLKDVSDKSTSDDECIKIRKCNGVNNFFEIAIYIAIISSIASIVFNFFNYKSRQWFEKKEFKKELENINETLDKVNTAYNKVATFEEMINTFGEAFPDQLKSVDKIEKLLEKLEKSQENKS